ncbi:MAG: helix-turn-helix transcriptional regulator [Syntrophotaleaceae bacterium]
MRAVPPALPFFFFVLWLLAVPMEGPLLVVSGVSGTSIWFLLPLVACLLLTGRFISPVLLEKLAPWGAAACGVATYALYLYPTMAPLLLSVMGIAATPITVRSAIGLLGAGQPLRAAAWCLVTTNLLLALLHQTRDFPAWPILFALLPLMTLPGIVSAHESDVQKEPLAWEYLPFIFIFQVVSGLMYGFLFPAYAASGLMQGLELVFYMLAVLGAVPLYRRDRDLLLLAGLSLGMLAFGLLQIGGAGGINLGMFAVMAAAGCIDLFLLALLLQSARPVKSFGFGLAALCGGIAAGQLLGLLLGDRAEAVGMAGSMALNIAALALFLRHHLQLRRVMDEREESEEIPVELACQLSNREQDILRLVIRGRSYREIAGQLGIAESTVKTHMRRIHEKAGVTDRKRLLLWLAQTRNP